MRTVMPIVFVAFLAACAGAAPRPQSQGTLQGRWEGFLLLRNGVREPMSVEVTEASNGQLSAGDNFVPLEDVRVSGNHVHFEASGEGAFDGVVAGDNIAGSVTGPVSGAFSLSRVDDTWSPYFLGP